MRVGYSALLLSSNPSLFACERGGPPRGDGFDEPRILATERPPDRTVKVPAFVRSSEHVGGYCYQHLLPGDTPAQDVHRLGVLCGPPMGLEPLGAERQGAASALRVRHRVDDRECVRVAVASADPDPLEVEWRARDRVLGRCSIERLGWCPEELPLCLASRDLGPGAFDVELALPGASDSPVAVRVWHRRE
jgi:hypothetical protein